MAEGKRRRGRGRVGLGVYKRAGEAGQEEGWFGMLRRRQEVANQAEAGRANPAAAAAAAATAGVVLASSSSQRHRVTESQTWWHCPAGEVARHRNTRPCQSSAGALRAWEAGGPRVVRPEPAQVGARTGCLPSSVTHITSFSHGGEGERGGNNWELEINVAQVAGWHLRRRTVETCSTE